MSLAICRRAIDDEGFNRALDVAGELRGAPGSKGGPNAWDCEIAAGPGVVHRFIVHIIPGVGVFPVPMLAGDGLSLEPYPPTPALWW